MILGSLGDIIFETSSEKIYTMQDFAREYKGRYEEHKVLGAKPRLEFQAPELATQSMQIKLRADFGVNPTEECKRIQEYVNTGKKLKLILGGENYGDHIIESVKFTSRCFIARQMFSVDMELSLKEYV